MPESTRRVYDPTIDNYRRLCDDEELQMVADKIYNPETGLGGNTI